MLFLDFLLRKQSSNIKMSLYMWHLYTRNMYNEHVFFVCNAEQLILEMEKLKHFT